MSDERLNRNEWEVRPCPLKVAQDLVGRLHYSRGGSNTGTFVHGLLHRDDPDVVRGVAWWLPPTPPAARASWGGDWKQVLSLSRLVIEPDVPKNAASFLLARSVKLIAADGRFRCLVTYADEWQGHTGAIYRAANWEYVGLTKPEAVFVDPGSGRMVARKAGPRTRTRADMAELGYVSVGKFPKHKFRLVLPSKNSNATRI